MVDRDIGAAVNFDGTTPSVELECEVDSEGGDGEMETAEKEGEGGCTCTVPGDTLDETLTLLTLILPPSGMATGREEVLGSTWPFLSRSFRSATAALTSA